MGSIARFPTEPVPSEEFLRALDRFAVEERCEVRALFCPTIIAFELPKRFVPSPPRLCRHAPLSPDALRADGVVGPKCLSSA
jgi:hypothetical protein